MSKEKVENGSLGTYKGVGEVLIAKTGTLMESTQSLTEQGASGLISAQDLYTVREGTNWRNLPHRLYFGNYVKEGIFYVPQKNTALLIRDGAKVWDNLEDGTLSNCDDVVGEYLKKAKDELEKPLTLREAYAVPLDRLLSEGRFSDSESKDEMNDDVAKWLVGDEHAKETVNQIVRTDYLFQGGNPCEPTFNQIWARAHQGWRAFYLGNKSFLGLSWATGVREK